MTEADFFSLMYPIVPLVGLAGFLPQVITLLRTREAPISISLSTWFVWTMTWVISFGYAAFVLHDVLFAATAGMNIVGHIVIIGLTIYKRQKYSQTQSQGRFSVAARQSMSGRLFHGAAFKKAA
jgi:hypothetical protein